MAEPDPPPDEGYPLVQVPLQISVEAVEIPDVDPEEDEDAEWDDEYGDRIR